jgi:hypothetical protein
MEERPFKAVKEIEIRSVAASRRVEERPFQGRERIGIF